MILSNHTRFHRLLIVLIFAVGLAACSDDGGSAPAAPADTSATSDQSATSTEAPSDNNVPAVGDNSDLVVPLDYLQGEWCNSDGEAWVFEGETARFGESHDNLFGELPVTAALAAGSERVLVSQVDDEFVLDLQTRQVTFTRGRC